MYYTEVLKHAFRLTGCVDVFAFGGRLKAVEVELCRPAAGS